TGSGDLSRAVVQLTTSSPCGVSVLLARAHGGGPRRYLAREEASASRRFCPFPVLSCARACRVGWSRTHVGWPEVRWESVLDEGWKGGPTEGKDTGPCVLQCSLRQASCLLDLRSGCPEASGFMDRAGT